MSDITDLKDIKVAIIGLGYVGLPLAVAFSHRFQVIGFDIDAERISQLKAGLDKTNEVSQDELRAAGHLVFTNSQDDIRHSNFFIVTVPTPIDKSKQPDLRPLLNASRLVGAALKMGDVVVFESTVYPGATEEECVPILEQISGLKFNKEFYCGYSPERINPGDKQHSVKDVLKVTSGSTEASSFLINEVYKTVILAGTYLAPSIKVAEAAKVIENTQRDLNIALINELAIIFNKMGINTREVLAAAGTKWNFLKFEPGLVGGHCIGVDPYYITHKAQQYGHNPEIILAGRRINDSMASFVAGMLIKAMIKSNIRVQSSKVLIMGLTFKENCPDLRNTKVIDLLNELLDYGVDVDVFDPVADVDDARSRYGVTLCSTPTPRKYQAIIVAVAHSEFKALSKGDMDTLCQDSSSIIFDLKGALRNINSDLSL